MTILDQTLAGDNIDFNEAIKRERNDGEVWRRREEEEGEGREARIEGAIDLLVPFTFRDRIRDTDDRGFM